MAREVMITTIDNPFDPFTDFKAWYSYDVQEGHHSCALLARISKTSMELSEFDQQQAIEAAIDEITEIDTTFKKVVRVT